MLCRRAWAQCKIGNGGIPPGLVARFGSVSNLHCTGINCAGHFPYALRWSAHLALSKPRRFDAPFGHGAHFALSEPRCFGASFRHGANFVLSKPRRFDACFGHGDHVVLSKPRCYVSGLALGWNRRACRTPGTGPKQRHGHGSGMPGPCVLGKPARCQRHMRVGDVHRTTANQIRFNLHRPSILCPCAHVLFITLIFLRCPRSGCDYTSTSLITLLYSTRKATMTQATGSSDF